MEPQVTIDLKEYNSLLEIKRNSENEMRVYKDAIDKKFKQHKAYVDDNFKRLMTNGHFVEYSGVFKEVNRYGTSYQVNPIYATRIVNTYESYATANTVAQLVIDRDQLIDKNLELKKQLETLTNPRKWWKIWKKN